MQMFKLDKRDIPGIGAVVGFAAVFLAVLVVGTSNVAVSLIISFVAAIVAILVAWKFASDFPVRIVWIIVAFWFTVTASVIFNEAHATQFFTIGTFLACAIVGLVVVVFLNREDADEFPIIPFALATITSYFVILILSATLVYGT